MGYADRGEYERAIQDYTAALRLNPKFGAACERLAWLYATCPKEKLRNGKTALEYARKALELSNREYAPGLEAIAAAHAANGQFAEAVKWQREALKTQQYKQYEQAEA